MVCPRNIYALLTTWFFLLGVAFSEIVMAQLHNTSQHGCNIYSKQLLVAKNFFWINRTKDQP